MTGSREHRLLRFSRQPPLKSPWTHLRRRRARAPRSSARRRSVKWARRLRWVCSARPSPRSSACRSRSPRWLVRLVLRHLRRRPARRPRATPTSPRWTRRASASDSRAPTCRLMPLPPPLRPPRRHRRLCLTLSARRRSCTWRRWATRPRARRSLAGRAARRRRRRWWSARFCPRVRAASRRRAASTARAAGSARAWAPRSRCSTRAPTAASSRRSPSSRARCPRRPTSSGPATSPHPTRTGAMAARTAARNAPKARRRLLALPPTHPQRPPLLHARNLRRPTPRIQIHLWMYNIVNMYIQNFYVTTYVQIQYKYTTHTKIQYSDSTLYVLVQYIRSTTIHMQYFLSACYTRMHWFCTQDSSTGEWENWEQWDRPLWYNILTKFVWIVINLNQTFFIQNLQYSSSTYVI